MVRQKIKDLIADNAILDVQDGNHGEKHPTAADYVENGIPFLMARDFQDGRVDLNGACKIPKPLGDSLRIGFARSGDVLLTHKGSVGLVAIVPNVPDYVMLTPQVTYYRTNPKKLLNSYLKYAFQAPYFRGQLSSFSAQSTRPYIGITAQKELQLDFPTLPIQRRVAGILSAYDELIENSQRRIKILETMARALYREWFVHFRFPGFEAVPRVPSALGEIPEGWEVKKLGDVADTFRGRSYRSVDLADEGGLPFLNLKCLDRDGGFRRSGLKRYTGDFKDIHVARKGDIVMAVTDMTQERRIVARAALVPTLGSDFGVFSMDLVRIEPKHAFPKQFVYSLLRYSSFADEVKQHANGANVLHLSPDRITDFQFAAPPAGLMSRFANFVKPIVEDIDTLGNEIQNLRHTRDLLLPRLLSGQIDVETLS